MAKPIFVGILVRFILLPLFGRLLLAAGIAIGAMPSTRDDPIFSLMILLQSFTPSANNIILVVDAGNLNLCHQLLLSFDSSCVVINIYCLLRSCMILTRSHPECRNKDGSSNVTAKSTTTYCQLSQYIMAPVAISVLTAISLNFVQNA
jgi:hypothetical protein